MVADCKFLSISRFSQGCDPVGGVEFDRKAGDHRQTGRFSCRLEDATDGNGQQLYLDPAAGIEAERDALHARIKTVLLYANRNLAHRTPEWAFPEGRLSTVGLSGCASPIPDRQSHLLHGRVEEFTLSTSKETTEPVAVPPHHGVGLNDDRGDC